MGEAVKDVAGTPGLGKTLGGLAGGASEDETTDAYIDSDGKMWVDGDDWNRLATDYNELLEHTESQQQVDALADAAEDVGEAIVDSVETLPFVGDALGDAHDVFEDVVDEMDEPVVEDVVVDPWG